jgi:hypothetical protein
VRLAITENPRRDSKRVAQLTGVHQSSLPTLSSRKTRSTASSKFAAETCIEAIGSPGISAAPPRLSHS